MIWKIANSATEGVVSLLNERVPGFQDIHGEERPQLEDRMCDQIMESIRDGFKDLYPRVFN